MQLVFVTFRVVSGSLRTTDHEGTHSQLPHCVILLIPTCLNPTGSFLQRQN